MFLHIQSQSYNSSMVTAYMIKQRQITMQLIEVSCLVSQLLRVAGKELLAPAKTVDYAARCSLGVQMYWKNAALCQRPNV